MSRKQRRQIVDKHDQALSARRQCRILAVNRSTVYTSHSPKNMENDLAVMRQIDEMYLDHPTFGSRRISVKLEDYGFHACRSRVQRLMRIMGIKAIYAKPKTSQPNPENTMYPYRLSVRKQVKLTPLETKYASKIDPPEA